MAAILIHVGISQRRSTTVYLKNETTVADCQQQSSELRVVSPERVCVGPSATALIGERMLINATLNGFGILDLIEITYHTMCEAYIGLVVMLTCEDRK